MKDIHATTAQSILKDIDFDGVIGFETDLRSTKTSTRNSF